MPGYVIGNFIVYCLINAFTPGPGNILALNTVTNYGWKKGMPLFLGIFSGYYAVQLICAGVVYGIGTLLPQMLGMMKYVGAAYIVWLAIHIAISRPDEEGGKSASFWKGFMLQFVNVKIYLFGITALTGYVTDYCGTYLPILILFELAVATIGTVATSVWVGMGMAIQKIYLQHYRIINIILAATLLECVYSILK